jgi:hypothetical protein
MMPGDKFALLNAGEALMQAFCTINGLPVPTVISNHASKWHFDTCAYYRSNRVEICVAKCAAVGHVGRAWSFPGHIVDRTPYGVVQHELGHHVDKLSGANPRAYWSDFSSKLRETTQEKPITSYAPNDAEWFAEIFRVFVTNPDLLRIVRPRTYDRLAGMFRPVYADTWRDRLQHAPVRTFELVEKTVQKHQRKRSTVT